MRRAHRAGGPAAIAAAMGSRFPTGRGWGSAPRVGTGVRNGCSESGSVPSGFVTVRRLVDGFGQAAAIVDDHQQVLEVVEVERRIEERGLDDRVGVAVDVDDLADQEALWVGERSRRPARFRP